MKCFRIPALWLLLLTGAAAREQDAKAYFGQGLEHLQHARFALAAEQFEKAVAADPTLVLARYDLGVCYFADGRFPEARKMFDAVLRLEPDRLFARYYIARLDLLEGHLDSAITALEPLAAQGLGADEFYLLGTAYLRKDKLTPRFCG